MRLLLALCLSLPMAAQAPLQSTLPGRDKDLYHREQARKRNEATVEIRAAVDPVTLKQIRFQEFMAWFVPDLHAFLGRYERVTAPTPVAIQLTEPPPAARVYPLGTDY